MENFEQKLRHYYEIKCNFSSILNQKAEDLEQENRKLEDKLVKNRAWVKVLEALLELKDEIVVQHDTRLCSTIEDILSKLGKSTQRCIHDGDEEYLYIESIYH